ncbi:MAG TPA: DNA methyltransferase [Polyangiaceae bacterium]|nr:DNA methyltransferase [Polyangiaceae bacterium]
MSAREPPIRPRRALTHVGGEVDVVARDPELGEALRRALDVDPDEDRVRAHVHGFHSYPARMHPDTALALIATLSSPRATVLDPFAGSGTVVVSARELGRRAIGSDLNPLSVALCRVKTTGCPPGFAEALLAAAERVVEHAKERQAKKLGPTHPYGPEDRQLYETYVLLALDGLRDGIERAAPEETRRTLFLVLSSMLTKLSRKRGDSSDGDQPKRLARSFAFRLFLLRTRELVEQLRTFTELMPPGTPPARVEQCDARQLGFLKSGSVDLVVSSPPYPGVYDYFAHHSARLRWLRMPGEDFRRGELGARRAFERDSQRGLQGFERDFTHCLSELARVITREGRVALLIADSAVSGRPLFVGEWLPPLVDRAGLRLIARASQTRPNFHEPSSRAFTQRDRREHLVLLARDT